MLNQIQKLKSESKKLKQNKLLLTQKEAVNRYGYSSSWWERQRWLGTGPKFIKLKGKIFYPLEATDSYFLSSGLKQSTSQYEGQ